MLCLDVCFVALQPGDIAKNTQNRADLSIGTGFGNETHVQVPRASGPVAGHFGLLRFTGSECLSHQPFYPGNHLLRQKSPIIERRVEERLPAETGKIMHDRICEYMSEIVIESEDSVGYVLPEGLQHRGRSGPMPG